VPSTSGNTRGAIEKTGSSCPLGFSRSGNYCTSSLSNNREAIQKTGKSCPLGWCSYGAYSVRYRWAMGFRFRRSARLGPLRCHLSGPEFHLCEWLRRFRSTFPLLAVVVPAAPWGCPAPV